MRQADRDAGGSYCRAAGVCASASNARDEIECTTPAGRFGQ